MKIFLRSKLLLAGSLFATGLAAQQSYTFTNAGATGANGPSQTQVNTAYNSTNLNGSVTVTGGIQSWTVPTTGFYQIEVTGASGGNTNTTYNKLGGLGSRMQGDFFLNQGTVLKILVGQRGTDGCGTGGGGGGTYVATTTTLLIAAGGGGGPSSDNHGAHSTTLTSGTNDNPGGSIPGGTNGGGGSACNVGSPGANHGGGGAGYIGNGATSTAPTPGGGGVSFLNGGTGGTGNAPGGFGGGGGGTNCTVGGGGGGGYSGGAGGQQVNYCQSGLNRTGGGGGGSFNSGTNQVNTPALNNGHGRVIITELCNISLTAAAPGGTLPAICLGQSATLTTNAVSNYSWSTGITGTNQIIVTPSVTTTYSVAANSSLSCTGYNQITVTVSPAVPNLSFAATSNSICMGDSVAFTALGALSYTFSGGIAIGPYYYPGSTTTYSASGQNGCGISNTNITVTVTPLQIAAIAFPTVVCALKPTTLTAAGATSFTWEPNSIQSQTIVVAPPSNFVYTVTGQTGGCLGQTTVMVNTQPNPTIQITATGSLICEGQTVNMQLSGADSYTWLTAGISGTNVNVSPAIPTSYDVTGSNSLGCTSSAQHIVIVYPKPKLVTTASPTIVCEGGTSTLSTSGADTYTWAAGSVQSSSTTVSPLTSTYFFVTGTENTHGCQGKDSVLVNVYQATIAVSQNATVCPGATASLSAGSAISYNWLNIPGGSTQNVTVAPTALTIYTVQANVSVGNQTCAATNMVQVDLYPAPTVTATSPKDMACRNERVQFSASGSGTQTYKWSNGMTVPAFTVLAVSTQPFQFTVTATDQNGCIATDAITVTVSNCPGFAELDANAGLKIYPNPSSGDFTIETAEVLGLRIINELGQVVQEIPAAHGKISISGLPTGLYFIQSETDSGTLRTPVIVQ